MYTAEEQSQLPPSGVFRPTYLPWLVGGLSGLLYLVTLAPGVFWQDSAMFQLRVWQFDLSGRLGLALGHPLYIVLCRAFAGVVPGDFAWRVNLFSAVCSAGAIGLFFAGMRRLSRSSWTALVGVGLLAVTHTFWTYAVMAEVYGLYALLLAVEMYLLVRYQQGKGAGNSWLLVGLLLVNGLSVSNHLLALLHLPAYGIYALLQIRAGKLPFRSLGLMAMGWVIGAGLYEAMIIVEIARGGGVIETIRSALFGLHWENRVVGRMPGIAGLAKSLGYFLLNFPTPLLVLGPMGIYFGLKDRQSRSVAALWFGICVVAFVFALRYDVPDQYVFFYPCYVFTAVFVGLGAGGIVKARPSMARPAGRIVVLVLALLPALVYEIAPGAVRRISLLRRMADKALRVERAIIGRDAYTHFLRPRKNAEHSARDFSLAALRLAQPDGLIIADNTTRNPIIYLQRTQQQYPGVHLSKGTDVKALHEEVSADVATVESWLASGRRVFVVSPARQSSLAKKLKETGRYQLVPRDQLYEILHMEEPND